MRSAKKAMYNVKGTQNMPEHILTTAVCVVEGILSQRPLRLVPDDVDSFEAIALNNSLIRSSGSEMFPIRPEEYEGHRKNMKVIGRISRQLK